MAFSLLASPGFSSGGRSRRIPCCIARHPAVVARQAPRVLIVNYGWRQAFFALGLIGIVLAAFWAVYFRNTPEQHPQVNKEELTLLQSAGGQLATAKRKVTVPRRVPGLGG